MSQQKGNLAGVCEEEESNLSSVSLYQNMFGEEKVVSTKLVILFAGLHITLYRRCYFVVIFITMVLLPMFLTIIYISYSIVI